MKTSRGAFRFKGTLPPKSSFPRLTPEPAAGLRKLREIAMKVGNCMTRNVQVANPEQSIREVAEMMGRLDAGVMPVGDHDRLVGMITDRDIAIRGVALDKGPDTKVRDVMSPEVKYCFDDETSSMCLKTWATCRYVGSRF
jgi:CBS domain-containing protein